MYYIRRYYPFIASALLLCIGVCLVFPYCQYYIDPDATAYLTIARRYADGGWFKAVNGYWSPWSCWLTAGFIRLGTTAIAGAILANTIGAVGILYVSQLFFIKYRTPHFAQAALQGALAIFLCYAVYYQNFDDLWECFFLLYALRIIVSHRFKYSPALWIGAGIAGACAYFAKAYAFPFFIISTAMLTFYINRAWHRKYIRNWLINYGVVLLMMCTLSLPWLFALHGKYGIWTTGTAGNLNMSWYLVGHPLWKLEFANILPPVYNDSPSYWEDPWYANGPLPMFWHSQALFARQLMKIVQNTWKFIVSSMQISVALLPVFLYVLRLLFKKIRRLHYKVFYPLLIVFLLFPLPFFLVNFEARYIWYMLPLSMILGIAIMQRNSLFNKKIFMLLFAGSYMLYPIHGIHKMWNEGREEYNLASHLKALGLKGSFVSNVSYGMPGDVELQRLAYFSGNRYFMASSDSVNEQVWSKAHIQYYFLSRHSNNTSLLSGRLDNKYPVLWKDENWKIYWLGN